VTHEEVANRPRRSAHAITIRRTGRAKRRLGSAKNKIVGIFRRIVRLKKMTTARRFSRPLLEQFAQARILGVRAGKLHRHTGVWVVLVDDRAFVRSWNDKPRGWFRAFANEPKGSVQLNDKEIAVLARRTRSERLQTAVSIAYAAKYNTKASEKWVLGFSQPERATRTLELVPA
jgi:hypothetical protein